MNGCRDIADLYKMACTKTGTLISEGIRVEKDRKREKKLRRQKCVNCNNAVGTNRVRISYDEYACKGCEQFVKVKRRERKPLQENFREWREVRKLVLKRDHYRCTRCPERYNLTVDHIIPLSQGGSPLDVENLRILCSDCHKTVDQEQQFVLERRAEIRERFRRKYNITAGVT